MDSDTILAETTFLCVSNENREEWIGYSTLMNSIRDHQWYTAIREKENDVETWTDDRRRIVQVLHRVS
jgi:hypothetical protein